MKHLIAAGITALTVTLTGCQNLPETKEGANRNVVFLKATHCLEEPVGDQDRIHFGPCLKITDVNGEVPTVRSDGFIELPVARPVTLGTSCVYRHADGTPIPATVGTAEFQVNSTTFPEAASVGTCMPTSRHEVSLAVSPHSPRRCFQPEKRTEKNSVAAMAK